MSTKSRKHRTHIPFVNPFELPQQWEWYKANLHTHTKTSDGAVWAEEAVELYRQRGYHVLALTDHGNANDIRGLSDRKMLVMNGLELHPPFHLHSKAVGEYHICAVGLPRSFALSRAGRREVQVCLNEVHRAGAVSILAHPKELSMTRDEIIHLKHVAGIEVWTTLSEVDGDKGSSEEEWAEAMEHNVFLCATGADDTHWAREHGWAEAFRGWTVLKMPSLTEKNVLEAIRTGATYASTGPTIHDFRIVDGKAALKCSPVVKIRFRGIGTQSCYRWAKLDATIRSFTMDIPDDWPCVRAVVTDACARRAWTNPLPV